MNKNNKKIKDIKHATRETKLDLTRKLGPEFPGKPGIHQDRRFKKPKYPEKY